LVDRLNLNNQVKFLELGENTDKNRERVAKALANCHILCLPSDNEGMSNAVLEGMATGLVLLLTNVGGTRELLEDGKNGYLIKRTVENILEKLKKLIDNRKLLFEMGKTSRKKVKKFSWKKVAGNYYSLYRNLK